MTTSKRWYLDEQMNWEAGFDLGMWTFGFNVHWCGFSIHFGPLYIGKSDAPF